MASLFDQAVEIAVNNDEGCNTAICELAKDVWLTIEGNAELCILNNHRPNAKRVQRTVSADWAYKFLTRAQNVTIKPYPYGV